MTKYKCPNPDCKYTSDEPGDCCGKPLEKISEKEEKQLPAKKSGGCSCC